MRKESISFILFIFSLVFSLDVYASKKTARFLAMSDLHFTPFDLCQKKETKKPCLQLIAELNKSEVEKWNDIFKKYYQNSTFPVYGQNTNYPLFQSLLSELKTISKNEDLSFVVILGDFLGHQYIEKYKLYAKDVTLNGQINFVKKTFLYLTKEIRAAIPENIEIYPVLGNNDSYIDNYNVDNPKTTNFYSDLKEIWAQFTPQIKVSNSFLNGGYYEANTQIKKSPLRP